eukprot:515669_1
MLLLLLTSISSLFGYVAARCAAYQTSNRAYPIGVCWNEEISAKGAVSYKYVCTEWSSTNRTVSQMRYTGKDCPGTGVKQSSYYDRQCNGELNSQGYGCWCGTGYETCDYHYGMTEYNCHGHTELDNADIRVINECWNVSSAYSGEQYAMYTCQTYTASTAYTGQYPIVDYYSDSQCTTKVTTSTTDRPTYNPVTPTWNPSTPPTQSPGTPSPTEGCDRSYKVCHGCSGA